MSRLPRLLLLGLALLAAGGALGTPVVIIHPGSGVERLSRAEVADIFLGRYRVLPNGRFAQPVEPPPNSALREEFYRLLVGKSAAEINAYWSRLIFSGKTTPPRQATSAEEVLAVVATTPGTIGYLDRSQVDGRVRVVLELAP